MAEASRRESPSLVSRRRLLLTYRQLAGLTVSVLIAERLYNGEGRCLST